MVRGVSSKALRCLYGKIYAENPDPRMSNCMTGKPDQENHHCPVCKADTTADCYLNLHLAYCIALVKEPISKDKSQYRICGCRFTPGSTNGCGKHHFSSGYNRAFKDAWKSQDFKFPDGFPDGLQHHDPAFIYRDRGAGSKKRDRERARRQDVAEQGGFVSMNAGSMRSQEIVDELNNALYLTPTPALPMSAATMGYNAGIGTGGVVSAPGRLGQKVPMSSLPGPHSISVPLPLGPPISQDAQMMLARMSGLEINDKQSQEATLQPKVLVELTEKDQVDPNNWKKYEEKKREREQEEERARLLKKEEAAKQAKAEGEAAPPRKKGQAKQALAPTAKDITKGGTRR